MQKDGSTLLTEAALCSRSSVAQRHQFEYAFYAPELRAVPFTAATCDNSFLRLVDATDAVCQTSGLNR